MPSQYLGCQLDDDLSFALNEVTKSLEEARQSTLSDIADLDLELQSFSTPEVKASVLVGDSAADNQVKWLAKTSGADGNKIAVFYEYLGPIASGGVLNPRPPSSSVVTLGEIKVVHLVLPVLATGEVDPALTVQLLVPIWLTPSEVQDLVEAEVQGTGTGVPTPTGVLYLANGKDCPLPNSEAAANSIARVFGQSSYQALLKSADVPVVESEADAISYIESLGKNCVLVGGKLFILSGTNLVGINKIYELVGKDLAKTKAILAKIAELEKLPYLLLTENVESVIYELVCGEMQKFNTVTETFREFEVNLAAAAARWTGNDLSLLNPYIFWSVAAVSGMSSSTKLRMLGIPNDYFVSVLTGESEDEQSTNSTVLPPQVFIVEDPALLSKLGLSDANLKALLEKNIPGVQVPPNTPLAMQNLVNSLSKLQRSVLPSGLRSDVKAAVALAQSLDHSKSFGDSDQLKELAGRGRACARLSQNNLNLPSVNLPDLPTNVLDKGAQKLEAAFGAISAAVSVALKVFDDLFNALKKVIMGFLNKITNLSSLSKNIFGKDLVQCLLGSGAKAAGAIDFSKIGPGTGFGSGGLAGGSTPSTGGLPFGKEAFLLFLGQLSSKLENTINTGLEKVMSGIKTPICMAMQILKTLSSVELGISCLAGKNLDEKCPPEETQEVVNSSSELSYINSLPQMTNEPKSSSSDALIKKTQAFTGKVESVVVKVKETITRGVQKIIDDIARSLDSKLSFVDEIHKAMRSLTDGLLNLNRTNETINLGQTTCLPPSVGFFSDTITTML